MATTNTASAFLIKTQKGETLKITCFMDIMIPRQVRKYHTIVIAREIPAGRWGILSTCDQAIQTAPTFPKSYAKGAKPQAEWCRRSEGKLVGESSQQGRRLGHGSRTRLRFGVEVSGLVFLFLLPCRSG